MSARKDAALCPCPECGKLCAGVQGLGSHRGQAHDDLQRVARAAARALRRRPRPIMTMEDRHEHALVRRYRRQWNAVRPRPAIRPDIHARFQRIVRRALARPLSAFGSYAQLGKEAVSLAVEGEA